MLSPYQGLHSIQCLPEEACYAVQPANSMLLQDPLPPLFRPAPRSTRPQVQKSPLLPIRSIINTCRISSGDVILDIGKALLMSAQGSTSWQLACPG